MTRNTLSAVVSIFAITAALLIALCGYKNRQQSTIEPSVASESSVVQIPTVVGRDGRTLAAAPPAQRELGVEYLKFPDGDEVEVRFRNPAPFKDGKYRPDNLAEGYDALVSLANAGDAFAATQLFESLEGCSEMFYKTSEQMEELRSDALQTRTYKFKDPESGEIYVDDLDDDGIVLSAIENSFKHCDGVTAEMEAEAVTWQKRAAELGDLRLTKAYVRNELGNTKEGRKYIKEVFDNGDYDAGSLLGIYLLGLKWPKSAEDLTQSVDEYQHRVDGFAYYYLAVSLAHADQTFGTGPAEIIHRDFNASIAHLMPHEHEAGIQRAKEILREHPACCRSMGYYDQLTRDSNDSAQIDVLN